jgi:RNA polymerase sigma-70 factor (ECF subfamily)
LKINIGCGIKHLAGTFSLVEGHDIFFRRPSNQTKTQFEELAFPLADKLYRIAYARLGNAQDAEDAVQETFSKAFRAFSSFKQGTNVGAWLSRIMLNVIADNLRKQQREPRPLSLDETADDSAPIDVASPNPGPEQLLLNNVLDAELQCALDSISEDLLTPFLLREIQELSYKEIAAAMDVPIGTVMSRLSRARAQLLKLLSKSELAKSRAISI